LEDSEEKEYFTNENVEYGLKSIEQVVNIYFDTCEAQSSPSVHHAQSVVLKYLCLVNEQRRSQNLKPKLCPPNADESSKAPMTVYTESSAQEETSYH
jgi:hypothetical protein